MVYVDDDTTKEKRFEIVENVETDMTDEEIKQFEEDWTKFWNPEVTKKGNPKTRPMSILLSILNFIY